MSIHLPKPPIRTKSELRREKMIKADQVWTDTMSRAPDRKDFDAFAEYRRKAVETYTLMTRV